MFHGKLAGYIGGPAPQSGGPLTGGVEHGTKDPMMGVLGDKSRRAGERQNCLKAPKISSKGW